MDEDTVKKILALKAAGLGRRRIGRLLGVNENTTGNICRRVDWKHIPLQPAADLPPGTKPRNPQKRPRQLAIIKIKTLSKRSSLIERLLRYINKTDTCWLWTKTKFSNGYGKISYKKTHIGAHRASWIAFRGEIPKGMFVLHSCDVRGCVNPDHLFLGSHKDNMEDMRNKGRAKGRQTKRVKRIKLNQWTAELIRGSNKTVSELARLNNVSRRTVTLIRQGRIWVSQKTA